MNENICIPREIGEKLDKLKFSSWNSSDRQIYEGEVHEVITYFDELECCEMKSLKKGLEEGIQKGIEKGIHKGIEKGIRKGLEKGIQRGLEEDIQKGIEKGLRKGLEEGIQRGEILREIKSLMERFFDDESLKNPLDRIVKHSLAEELAKEVWNGHIKKEKLPPGKTWKILYNC
jgi:flagellar biosynthesis/type III secretory pathway protein FliH